MIRSIASDAGHCLVAGIVEESRVTRVANRLLQERLVFRMGHTYAFGPASCLQSIFLPSGGQSGRSRTVVSHWDLPGYGLHGEMHTLARALFEAARLFPHDRLPETFGGHPRSGETPFPGLYIRANWPQAWSASSVFTILQAMLSLYPYAPANVLFVDPHLPEWLPEITIWNLRIGKAAVNLKFRRKEDGTTDYKVIDLKGNLHVLRQPSPWSLTAGWAERVKDAILSLLPHHGGTDLTTSRPSSAAERGTKSTTSYH